MKSFKVEFERMSRAVIIYCYSLELLCLEYYCFSVFFFSVLTEG